MLITYTIHVGRINRKFNIIKMRTTFKVLLIPIILHITFQRRIQEFQNRGGGGAFFNALSQTPQLFVKEEGKK